MARIQDKMKAQRLKAEQQAIENARAQEAAGRIADDALRSAPRSLWDAFDLQHVSAFGTGGRPVSISLTLAAKQQDGLALGTVTKIRGTLGKQGWEVSEPEVEAGPTYGKGSLYISLTATKNLSLERGRLTWRLRREPSPLHRVQLHLTFSNMPETERCRIVEKSVLVPEHWEPKRVVQCDEVEALP